MIDRALVVALGSIGTRHLRLLREEIPEADICVLRNSGCTDSVVPHANACFDTLKKACEFSPQLAIIANPAPFHIDVAYPLAKSGTHLLIEKPISNNIEGIGDLIKICESNKVVLQVGYNLRFLKTLQRFRNDIHAGLIGDVLSIRCEIGQYLPSWRAGADYRAGVSARSDLGGGALLELSHELDMLRWVFGEISWASSWMGRLSTLEIDVEDCVMLQLGLQQGAVAQVSMDLLRHDTTRICTAIGSKGSLRWDAISGTVSHFDKEHNTWSMLMSEKIDQDYSYRQQIRILLKAINGKSWNMAVANGSDGLAVMNIVESIRISSRENGCRVFVNGETI